jgi:putative hydrolase of the HAD superfamily
MRFGYGMRPGISEAAGLVNIVFDLGGVLLTWNPQAIIAAAFAEEATRTRVLSEVFGHRDWVELDRGTLPIRDAIARAALRTGLPEEDLTGMFMQVPSSLVPVPEMVDLFLRLKEQGHSLYCLSNLHINSYVHLKAEYTFWNLFEGAVISCLVHLCKPEPAIYSHLLDTFKLNAHDTLFIDDLQVNLDAAKPLGIGTVRFMTQAQCERDLKAAGCL